MGAKDQKSPLEILLKDSHIVQWQKVCKSQLQQIATKVHKCVTKEKNSVFLEKKK